MFELFDIWKAHRRTTTAVDWTISAASLRIPDGRKIGMLGTDAGKNSTVLRLLAGLEDPDQGVIRRTGVPCWPFGYSGFSDNNATLRQNATFLGRVYGVDADDVVRISSALSGVRPTKGKMLKQYLGQERRAIELGLTLAIQFDWYFIDEKLPKMPDETADAIHAAIADRLGRASMIWASTSVGPLRKICDAGMVLDQGLLTFYDDFEQAAEAFERTSAAQTEIGDLDDGKSGRKKHGRAARRARANGAEQPV